MMSARVFIHPRCLNGPAQAALEADLVMRGIALDELCISPPTASGNFELVRLVGKTDIHIELERMDGMRVIHLRTPTVAPEAA